jgi:hypothetical protein
MFLLPSSLSQNRTGRVHVLVVPQVWKIFKEEDKVDSNIMMRKDERALASYTVSLGIIQNAPGIPHVFSALFLSFQKVLQIVDMCLFCSRMKTLAKNGRN